MSGNGIVCTACGFANLPDDRFCGSCGTFLEWVAAAGEPEADPPAATPTADSAIGGVPTPGATAPAGATSSTGPGLEPLPAGSGGPDPGDGGSGTARATSPGSTGGLLRCPGCGIANQPARTFCQSCGATLAGARPVSPVAPEVIAAAVARTPDRPTTAAEPRTGAATAGRSGGAVSGGGAGWVIWIVILGLLAGAAVTAFQFLTRPQLPPSEVGPTLPPAPTEPAVQALAPGATIRVDGGPIQHRMDRRKGEKFA